MFRTLRSVFERQHRNAYGMVLAAERQCGLVDRAQAKYKFTGGVDLGKLFKSLSSSFTVCEMGNG